MKAVFFCLCLMAASVVGLAQGTPPLTVREADNSPRKSGINTLIFPNGSVSIAGSVATITISGGATPAGSNGDLQMVTSGALAASSLNEGASAVTSAKNLRVPGSGGSLSATNMQIGTANNGFYVDGGLLVVASAGTASMAWNGGNGNTTIHGTYQLVFGSSGLSSPDVGFTRSGTNTLRLSNAAAGFGTLYSGGVRLEGVLEANLGSPSNGTVVYCSDCTIANPCASGGTGAIAKRLNGVWVCN